MSAKGAPLDSAFFALNSMNYKLTSFSEKFDLSKFESWLRYSYQNC